MTSPPLNQKTAAVRCGCGWRSTRVWRSCESCDGPCECAGNGYGHCAKCNSPVSTRAQRRTWAVMDAEINGKCCCTCREKKPLSEFSKQSRSADGKHAQCKPCSVAAARASRAATDRSVLADRQRRYNAARPVEKRRAAYLRSKERTQAAIAAYQKANPEKHAARLEARAAVAKGQLVKPSECSACHLAKPVEAHHHDYSKPLDVQWVCRTCHARIHRKYKEAVAS